MLLIAVKIYLFIYFIVLSCYVFGFSKNFVVLVRLIYEAKTKKKKKKKKKKKNRRRRRRKKRKKKKENGVQMELVISLLSKFMLFFYTFTVIPYSHCWEIFPQPPMSYGLIESI
jgi:hypothetical protein